jgi:hypothetical protein
MLHHIISETALPMYCQLPILTHMYSFQLPIFTSSSWMTLQPVIGLNHLNDASPLVPVWRLFLLVSNLESSASPHYKATGGASSLLFHCLQSWWMLVSCRNSFHLPYIRVSYIHSRVGCFIYGSFNEAVTRPDYIVTWCLKAKIVHCWELFR